MNICAITNCFNETFHLPRWISHYGRQLGENNLIVLDHGSDESALSCIGKASLIRTPRSAFDDLRRSAAISSLVESMLRYYDVVIYSDTDELLVADPSKYSSLKKFFENTVDQYYSCIGLNVIHNVLVEAPLDILQPILLQRNYCQFVSPMCKTLATRRPIKWGGGFHSSSVEPSFTDLYLFHLRPVDFGEALRRLSVTRHLVWSDPNAGLHQRQENKGLFDLFKAYASWDVSEDFGEVDQYKQDVRKNVKQYGADPLFYLPLDIMPPKLYRIPAMFARSF